MAELSKHEFKTPERRVKAPEDMDQWYKSQAHAEFISFIRIVNDAVKGKKTNDDISSSPAIDKLLGLLDTLNTWVDETPPVDQPQRFGNKSFRTWWERLRDNAISLIESLLPDDIKGAAIELQSYLKLSDASHPALSESFVQFVENYWAYKSRVLGVVNSIFDKLFAKKSFGNPTRIDYGTGHEFKFCAFLCCLMKLGVVPQSDAAAVALKVVNKYLDLIRRMQTLYRMEPAGSHGVWGLDDFQFLPFIWGSAQLIGQSKLEPKSFVDKSIAEQYADEYLFMGCIKYINSVKTGPFAEHSNTLWGISGVAEWTKVNSGLIKMYKAEVIGKFPVIQHFPFGTILSFEQVNDS